MLRQARSKAAPITSQLRILPEVATTVPGSPNTGPLLKKGKKNGERLATEACSVATGLQSGAACVAPAAHR